MYPFTALLIIGLLVLPSTYAVEYNIALNKAVTTSNNIPDHLATMAIDQELSTYLQVGPGSNGPGYNQETWIYFDLKEVYNITKIIIWPTNDDHDYYLARSSVHVRLVNYTHELYDAICLFEKPVKGVAYSCSNNDTMRGRYVMLKKTSSFENLKVAEVAIITEDTDYLVPITGQAEQSNVLYNSPNNNASNALDGDLYTCINTGQDLHENINIPDWWRVDIGDTYQVRTVSIHSVRGNLSVYVDNGSFTKIQLCSFFNQSSWHYTTVVYLKCGAVLTGRYLTVEKMGGASYIDALTFCEIQVFAIYEGPIYTLPNGYNNSLRTTITIPSSKKIPSALTSPISVSTVDTCSNDCYSCQQKVQLLEQEIVIASLQTEKMVIGFVVGILAAIIFTLLGFLCGYCCYKKRNMKPTNSVVYDAPKNESGDQHEYSDINDTPLKEINAYDNKI